jgi:hypothetical protein
MGLLFKRSTNSFDVRFTGSGKSMNELIPAQPDYDIVGAALDKEVHHPSNNMVSAFLDRTHR